MSKGAANPALGLLATVLFLTAACGDARDGERLEPTANAEASPSLNASLRPQIGPPDVRSHCIAEAAGGAIVPVEGYPMSTLIDAWHRAGAITTWEKNGERWILRAKQIDPLTRNQTELSLEMIEADTADQFKSCGPQSMIIQRLAADGQVYADMMMQDLIFAIVRKAAGDLALTSPSATIRESMGAPVATSDEVWTGPTGSDVAASEAEQRAAGPVDLYFSVPDGGHPTARCSAMVDGQPLFDGICTLNTEGPGTSLFSPHDGCTFDVFKKGDAVVATLSAYRNACDPVDASSHGGPIDLGVVRRQANCWIGARTKFCAG